MVKNFYTTSTVNKTLYYFSSIRLLSVSVARYVIKIISHFTSLMRSVKQNVSESRFLFQNIVKTNESFSPIQTFQKDSHKLLFNTAR